MVKLSLAGLGGALRRVDVLGPGGHLHNQVPGCVALQLGFQWAGNAARCLASSVTILRNCSSSEPGARSTAPASGRRFSSYLSVMGVRRSMPLSPGLPGARRLGDSGEASTGLIEATRVP